MTPHLPKTNHFFITASILALCALNPALAVTGNTDNENDGIAGNTRSTTPTHNGPTHNGDVPVVAPEPLRHVPVDKGKEKLTDKELKALQNAKIAIEKKIILENEFSQAVLNREVEKASTLLEKGVNVNSTEVLGTTALHMAVLQNDIAMFLFLLFQGKANVTARDLEGNTPLHLAAWNGNWNMVNGLLQKDKTVLDTKNNNGHTPRDVAAIYHAEKHIPASFKAPTTQPLFLEPEFKMPRARSVFASSGFVAPNTNVVDEEMYPSGHGPSSTPVQEEFPAPHTSPTNQMQSMERFFIALKTNDVEGVRQAIEDGADVTRLDQRKRTTLHIAVFKRADVKIIKLLLESGVNVSAKDNNGNTPIHLAACMGQVDTLVVLLTDFYYNNLTPKEQEKFKIQQFECLDIKNNAGKTPQDMAQSSGDPGLIRTAANRTTQVILENLLETYQRDLAAEKAVKSFIKAKHPVAPKVKLSEGDQMLFDAVDRNNPDFISTAQVLGANINAKNHQGKTALQLAIEKGSIPLTEALLDNGAATDLTQVQKNDLLDLTFLQNNESLVLLVTDHLTA